MSKSTLPVSTPATVAPTRTGLSRNRWAAPVFIGLRVLLDACLIPLSFVLAWRLSSTVPLLHVTLPTAPGRTLVMLGVADAAVLIALAAGGLYRLERGVSRVDTFYKICRQVSLGLVLAIAANWLIHGERAVFSRRLLVVSWVLMILLVTAGRLLLLALTSQLRVRGVVRDRLLIVGTGETARIVGDKLRRGPELGYDIVGFLAHPGDGPPPEQVDQTPVYGTTARLADVVRRHRVDEVIIALDGHPHEEILELVYQVIDLPVDIKVYPDTFRLITNDEPSISDLVGLPMITVRTIGLRAWSRVVKRAMDLAVSTGVLIFLSPLMLLLALLVKLDSPGPVFFVQERVGHDGVPFNLLKFRSMPVDAEAETGPVWATPNDNRPTRLGRIMRRYSLDELPQFINVFLGEMSVVGPRPERPYFVEQFRQTIPYYMARHREKAGITGWAQVNGLRGDTSIVERTHYDLYYVENWSLLLDIKIIMKTLVRVVSDEQAY